MQDKDRFDAYMQLANFRLHRSDVRQQTEYRLSLSLWALMAAATLYIPVRPNDLLLSGILVLIFITHALLLGQMWVRNENDQDNAFYYLENAESTLTPLEIREKPEQIQDLTWSELWFGFIQEPHLNWSTTFQILTTAILAVGVFIFLGNLGRGVH